MLSYHVVLFFGKEMQLGRHTEALVLLVAMGYVCSALKRAALGARFWLGPLSSTAAAR